MVVRAAVEQFAAISRRVIAILRNRPCIVTSPRTPKTPSALVLYRVGLRRPLVPILATETKFVVHLRRVRSRPFGQQRAVAGRRECGIVRERPRRVTFPGFLCLRHATAPMGGHNVLLLYESPPRRLLCPLATFCASTQPAYPRLIRRPCRDTARNGACRRDRAARRRDRPY